MLPLHSTRATSFFHSSIHAILTSPFPHPCYFFLFFFFFYCFFSFFFIFLCIFSCSFFIFFLYPCFTFLFFLTLFHSSLSRSVVISFRVYRSLYLFTVINSLFFTSEY